jgi:hypothetical protein
MAWLLGAALGLTCLGALAVSGVRLAHELSCTADEPGHLSAGLAYAQGDYRQSTANLFFTQRWAAWPLSRAGQRPPAESLQRELEWNPTWIGESLLFSGASDPRTMLAPARTMTLVLCLLGGVLVWAWASRLGGPWAGALAALLYAACPVVLANGTLVTTDTGAALGYVGATACYGWMLRRPSAVSAALTGACAAMLGLSKFSVFAWVLGAALLLAWRLRAAPAPLAPLRLAAWHAAALLVAWACIWAFFGWEFRPGGHTYLSLEPVTKTEHAVAVMDRLRLLPEPVLRELLSLRGLLKPRPGYLLGEFRMGGFWYYFPVAFLAKSTLGMLLALAAWLALRRGREGADVRPGMPAVVAGTLGYAVAALLSPLNIGVRHILPLYLFAAIAGGVALCRIGRRGPLWRTLTAAVAVLAAAEGYSARRQPIAWFNALWGGPMNGYRVMVESSLEWGGDLPQLGDWEKGLRARDQASPVYVSLLGPPGYEHFGLPAADLGSAFEGGLVRPGYFVFSATRLVGGPWEFYGAWNDVLAHAWNIYGAGAWHRPLPRRLAQLAVARLAASCRPLQPTQRIGPEYFVYHLDAGTLEAALGRLPAQ